MDIAYFSEPLVDEGYLILGDEQILACFKPVLDQLMEMAGRQIIDIKRRGGELKATATFSVASLDFLNRDRQL